VSDRQVNDSRQAATPPAISPAPKIPAARTTDGVLTETGDIDCDQSDTKSCGLEGSDLSSSPVAGRRAAGRFERLGLARRRTYAPHHSIG
jgi:hypothetical protein